jgi:hypothetical protein
VRPPWLEKLLFDFAFSLEEGFAANPFFRPPVVMKMATVNGLEQQPGKPMKELLRGGPQFEDLLTTVDQRRL